MIHNNLINLINSSEVIDQLNQKHVFLTFEHHKGTIQSWKIIRLKTHEVWLRKLFGCYRNTHQSQVSQALKKELRSLLVFDENVKSVKSIARIAHRLQYLQDSGEEESHAIAEPEIDRVSQNQSKQTFKKTVAFIEKNQDCLKALKEEGISFKIKSAAKKHLAIRVTTDSIMILAKKYLGQGGFKKIKTAYDVDKQAALARGIMLVAHPRMNWISRLIKRHLARSEIKALEQVKDNETCVQLKSSYHYVENEKEKFVMLMELADGDLSELNHANLTEEEQLDIISQLIDILMFLSQRDIWHRDIKPNNFLFFKKEGKYKVVMADFGLTVPDKDLLAQKFPVGTPGYIAPENQRFFRLFNSKKGDVYSMGKTLENLAFTNQFNFMHALIQGMVKRNPKERLNAEEVQQRFQEGLQKYQNNKVN